MEYLRKLSIFEIKNKSVGYGLKFNTWIFFRMINNCLIILQKIDNSLTQYTYLF